MDKKLQKKAVYELARDIRHAAVSLCRHHNAKACFVRRSGNAEISVTNDGGYRSILVGDASSKKYSYILLYSEQADDGEFRRFRQFPLLKDIENSLSSFLEDGRSGVVYSRSWNDIQSQAEEKARAMLHQFVSKDIEKIFA